MTSKKGILILIGFIYLFIYLKKKQHNRPPDLLLRIGDPRNLTTKLETQGLHEVKQKRSTFSRSKSLKPTTGRSRV